MFERSLVVGVLVGFVACVDASHDPIAPAPPSPTTIDPTRVNPRPSDQLYVTTDVELVASVERALHEAANVDGGAIDVDVIDGVVYLEGRVRTITARETAHDTAATTPGVRRVENRLRVNPPVLGERPYQDR